MVALGFGQRFWGGDRLKQGQLSPTSAGGEFEEATEESVATLNTKMNALFADVNRRLDDLER